MRVPQHIPTCRVSTRASQYITGASCSHLASAVGVTDCFIHRTVLTGEINALKVLSYLFQFGLTVNIGPVWFPSVIHMPSNPALHVEQLHRPCQLSTNKMDMVKLVKNDRDVRYFQFSIHPISMGAT